MYEYIEVITMAHSTWLTKPTRKNKAMLVLLRGIMKALFAHGWFMNEFFYRSAKCPQQRYDRERQDASRWLYFSLKSRDDINMLWFETWLKIYANITRSLQSDVTSLHFRLNKFHNSFSRKKEQNLDYDTWLDSTLTSTAQPTQSASNVKKGMPLCPVTCRDWLDHTKS